MRLTARRDGLPLADGEGRAGWPDSLQRSALATRRSTIGPQDRVTDATPRGEGHPRCTTTSCRAHRHDGLPFQRE